MKKEVIFRRIRGRVVPIRKKVDYSGVTKASGAIYGGSFASMVGVHVIEKRKMRSAFKAVGAGKTFPSQLSLSVILKGLRSKKTALKGSNFIRSKKAIARAAKLGKTSMKFGKIGAASAIISVASGIAFGASLGRDIWRRNTGRN